MLAHKILPLITFSMILGAQAHANDATPEAYQQDWIALDAAYKTANDDPGFKTRTKGRANLQMYTDYAKRVGEARERIQIAVAASAKFQAQYGGRKQVDSAGRELLGKKGYKAIRTKHRLKKPSQLIYQIGSNQKRFERNVDGNYRRVLNQVKQSKIKGKTADYVAYLAIVNELSPNDERTVQAEAKADVVLSEKAAKIAAKENAERERVAQREQMEKEREAAAEQYEYEREQQEIAREAAQEEYEAARQAEYEFEEQERARAAAAAGPKAEAKYKAERKTQQLIIENRAAYMATDDATLAERRQEVDAIGKQLRHSPVYSGRDSAETVSAFILKMKKNQATAPDYKPQYVNVYMDGDWREGRRKSGHPVEYYRVEAIQVYTDDVISKHDLAYALSCRYRTKKSSLPRPELPLTGIDGPYSCGAVSYVKLSTHRR